VFLQHFKKIFLLPFVLMLFLAPYASADLADEETVGNPGRLIKNINDHWKFHQGPQGTKDHFSIVNFNDSSWEQVSLPHTWNAEDGTDGGNNYYRGDGWYRKELHIPESAKGKALFLQFGAANKEAEVYVNGKAVNTHIGGYTAFTVDITDYVNYGQTNLIVVRVNNEVKDTIPLSGDFTFYGGLYRGVNLVVVDKTHIDVQDNGSKGVYISIPNDKSIKDNASVSVKVPVKVDKTDAKKVTVKTIIKNAEGKKIAYAELKAVQKGLKLSSPAGGVIFTGTMQVKNPHLWNGTKDPYLYTVEVIVERQGKVIDQVTEKAGFRYYSIDPDKGFILNGKSYPLHGVAIHQDREGYGNAVPDKVRAEDFDLLKEIGANTIRTAHYPHSQFVYDQADKMGLIVWAENPFVNEMRTTTEFADNAEKQLTEMIKQNYNHPSIVTWGLQNELGAFGGYLPRSGVPDEAQYQKATKLLKRLAAAAKNLNPERFVSQAIMGMPAIKESPLTPKVDEQLDWGSNKAANGGLNKIAKFINISSLNFYFGWYTPNMDELDTAITIRHKNYPDAVIGLSEYGAGANPFQHQLIRPGFHWQGFKDAVGQWHPEEYQNYYHERSYAIIEKHPELWATHVWNMFDFGSDSRNEGNNPGINDKGLVTFDRKIKKDSFYFYKAQWNKKDPFVYITSRRYTNRAERVTPIKVYSNLTEVTLTVNGKDYGKGRLQQPGVFVWDQVELKASTNVVTAAAKKADGTNVIDRVMNWKVN
jgi:beta-galactosidase